MSVYVDDMQVGFGQLPQCERVGVGGLKKQDVLAPGCQIDPDGAMAPAMNVFLGCGYINVVGADVAQQLNEGVMIVHDGERADGGARISSDTVDVPLIAEHEFHQNAHGTSLDPRRAEHESTRCLAGEMHE